MTQRLNKSLLAKCVSNATHPFLTVTVALLFAALSWSKSQWLETFVVSESTIVILPALLVYKGIVAGKYDSIDISDRSKRGMPIIFSLMTASLNLIYLLITNSSVKFILFYLEGVVLVITVALLTAITKVSVHLALFSGIITSFSMLLDWRYSALYLLLPLIAWARIQVKAHTLLQVVLGSFTGIVACLVMSLCLRL